MSKQIVLAVLSSQIAYLREIQLLEAAQTRLREGFVMDSRSYNAVSTDKEHQHFSSLKKLLQDTTDDDQSIEDNMDFILKSIHKRIQVYKCIMNNEEV